MSSKAFNLNTIEHNQFGMSKFHRERLRERRGNPLAQPTAFSNRFSIIIRRTFITYVPVIRVESEIAYTAWRRKAVETSESANGVSALRATGPTRASASSSRSGLQRRSSTRKVCRSSRASPRSSGESRLRSYGSKNNTII